MRPKTHGARRIDVCFPFRHEKSTKKRHSRVIREWRFRFLDNRFIVLQPRCTHWEAEGTPAPFTMESMYQPGGAMFGFLVTPSW
jgi:hypothetical protein